MSLLNDMLRDLSQAQKTTDVGSTASLPDQRELLSESGMVKPGPGRLWPSLVAFVVVASSLLAWRYWGVPEQNPIGLPDKLPNQELSLVTAPQPELREEVQTNTDSMQSQTRPDALALEANDSSPLASVKEIVAGEPAAGTPAAGTPAADATIELNERLAALEMAINKLSANLVITPEQPSVAVAESHQVKDEFVHDEAGNSVQESTSIRDPFAQTDSPPELNHRDEEQQDLAIPEDAHLSIAPNPVYLDQRKAQEGRDLYAQGRAEVAIKTLEDFIARSDAPRESMKALLDILNYQEDAQAMQAYLQSAEYFSPVEKHFYTAKLAIIEGREAEAVTLLEARLGEAGADENYRALLAGLYQRRGQFLEAATAYRRLLDTFGERPAYWLGFALAQDSLNQLPTARQAYLRVAEFPDLQPQVQAYIQQRLAALQ